MPLEEPTDRTNADLAYGVRSELLELARRVVDDPKTHVRVAKTYGAWYPALKGATDFFLEVSDKTDSREQAQAACGAREDSDAARRQAFQLYCELMSIRARSSADYAEALQVLEACDAPDADLS